MEDVHRSILGTDEMQLRPWPGPNRRLALDGGFAEELPLVMIRETTTGIHQSPPRTMLLDEYVEALDD